MCKKECLIEKKIIPLSEEVLCKDGWVAAESIHVGSELYGTDGFLHKVKDIIIFEDNTYKVTLKFGENIRLGSNSILRVSTKKQEENMRKYGDKRYKYITFKELLSNYESNGYIKNKEIKQHKYSVSQIDFIRYPKSELPINPYLLGLLLGDGGFTCNVITFTNPENDLWEELNKLVSDINMELHCRNFENHIQATICSKNAWSTNFLKRQIKSLGLDGLDSRQKFIPNIYMRSSEEDRFMLLSGIINTDGHIKSDGSIHIDTYSKNMYLNIKELLGELGFIFSFSEYDRTSPTSTKKYDKEIEYVIRIYPTDYNKFHLSKKHLSKLKQRKNYPNKIVNIQHCGEQHVINIILEDDKKIVTRDCTTI